MSTNKIKARLEYLRGEIEAERISYGEIAELQSLKEHIEDGDTVLLEWAGVSEGEVERGTIQEILEEMSDDDLTEKREELIDYLEKGMKQEYIDKLHKWAEVERELTLREEDPR